MPDEKGENSGDLEVEPVVPEEAMEAAATEAETEAEEMEVELAIHTRELRQCWIHHCHRQCTFRRLQTHIRCC